MINDFKSSEVAETRLLTVLGQNMLTHPYTAVGLQPGQSVPARKRDHQSNGLDPKRLPFMMSSAGFYHGPISTVYILYIHSL